MPSHTRSAVLFISIAGALFAANQPENSSASQILAHMPLSFERNAGQDAARSVEWIGHARGYRIALGPTGASIMPTAGRAGTLKMEFVGAHSGAASQTLDPLPGKTNYLIGNDSHRWIRNLDTYGRIAYRDAYPGIDVAWYGNQGQLEYDFLLRAGADPNSIRVRFEGAGKLALEDNGALRIETSTGSMWLRTPEIYQETGGIRQHVAGHYVLRGADEIAFELSAYDKSRPLVIDPTLSYGTYFGDGLSIKAITTDSAGNVYIAGSASTGVPLEHAMQSSTLGGSDIWVAKFNPAGTTLLYSTYIGGSREDNLTWQSAIAVDSADELLVAGQTFSTDFPLVNPAQSEPPANPSSFCLPFALKLNAAGNALIYSTYLGGNPPDGGTAWAVATDSAGNGYIAGEADGLFATTSGVYQTAFGGGWSDAFVVKLSPTGAIVYSTMIGGSGLDYATAIAADAKGNVYVAGETGSTAFPDNPPGAVTTNAGGLDVFVAKLNSTGTKVAWLTLLGGSGDDIPTAMVRDASSGQLYIAGSTTSPNLPVTSGVIQTAAHGPQQGFVASVNPNGLAYGFVTYLGGGRADSIQALALTGSGLVVGGSSTSTSFPSSNAIQPEFVGPTTTVYASTNSGAAWSPADTGLPAQVAGLSPDPANPGEMLAVSGTSFQWFKTTNGGAKWTRSGSDSLYLWWHPAGAQIVRAPSSPSTIYTAYPYAVGEDNGSLLAHNTDFLAFGSTNDGATWQPLAAPPAASNDSIAGIAVNPTNANEILEISSRGAVFQSTNGGAGFTQVSSLGTNIYPTWGFSNVVAGSPDGSIYIGACNLLISPDFGITWNSQWLGECISDVAVSPSNPSIVYAANAYSSTMDIYQSTDAGSTWTKVGSPAISDFDGSVLVVAPTSSNILYAASGNQISMSANGGVSWSTPVTMPSNVWSIGVSASNPADVYAAVGTSTSDGFAAKISTDGTTLIWSTFYTGAAGSSVNAAAPGANAGSAWIAGSSSAGLPLSQNAGSTNAYVGTAFLARIADTTAACSYNVSPASLHAYGTGSVNVTVTAPSSCAWTATSAGSWISFPGGSTGTGSAVITAALAANSNSSTRSGSISVGGKTVTIKQAAASCTYGVSGSTGVPSAGGALSLTVTAPTGCPWIATSLSSAVSVVSGASGTGNGTVMLSVAANNSVGWLYPSVQIGPQAVQIQQADPCTYALSPESLGDQAASGTMTVTANLAGCSWSSSSNAAWLTVSGSGVGTGTFPYSVQQNTSGQARAAAVTLDQQTFTVTQQP